RISRSNTRPCLSGRRKSMMTASNSDEASRLSAVRASGACSGRKPLCARALSSQAAISRSSSTNSTRMGFVFLPLVRTLVLYPLAQVAGFLPTPEQDGGQLVQGKGVVLALELYAGIERHPVLAPAPGIELGAAGRPQADVGVAPDHAQQKPDLFLPFIVAARVAPNEIARHVVTQPVTRPS